MNIAAIPFPPRSDHLGSDICLGVVTLVRNRLPHWDFTTCFNRVVGDGKLLQRDYCALDTALHFDRLLNRVEHCAGLSPGASIERSADDVGALARRFAPPFAFSPAATQWDVLSRAVEQLERAGVPEKLMNRAPEGVAASDWSAAQSRADGVLALLDSERSHIADRGPLLEHAPVEQVRGTFRSAVRRLMDKSIDPLRPGNLNLRQAFDWLKENEPIFWTLAMLSFEP